LLFLQQKVLRVLMHFLFRNLLEKFSKLRGMGDVNLVRKTTIYAKTAFIIILHTA
jgi:hypothetical protein